MEAETPICSTEWENQCEQGKSCLYQMEIGYRSLSIRTMPTKIRLATTLKAVQTWAGTPLKFK